MTPSNRHTRALGPAAGLAAIFSIPFSAHAVDVIKANNSDSLTLGSSWVSSVAPGNTDVATWDGTVTGSNTVSLGADLSWAGIKLTSPGGSVTIGGSNTLTLGSSGITMTAATQNLTLNHAVTLGADQTWSVASGIALAANGAVGGSGKLTKAGNGTLVLTGTNGYAGGTTLTAGTVSFTNGSLGTTGLVTMNGGRLLWAGANTQDLSSRLAFVSGKSAFIDTNGNSVTFASNLSGAFGTTQTFTKLGAGTLTLSGANAYTGGTTLQEGTLTLDYSSQDNSKLADASKLILKGGTLELSGGNHIELVGSTELYSDNSGIGGRATTVTRSSGLSVLQMNALTRAAFTFGATINFGQAGIATTDTTNTNGIIGGWATVDGTNWATNSSNGADGSITAYSGYVDDTWAAGNNVTVTTDTSQSSATANSLRFNDEAARIVTLSGTNVLTSGGILVTDAVGTHESKISGGTLTATGGQDLVIHQHNTDGILTISSIIANNVSNVALTKSGAGKLVLTTATTHGGGTYVNQGVLMLKGAAANTNMLAATGGRIYIAQGASLELENVALTNQHALQLSGTGIADGGAIHNLTGSNSLGGSVSLYADSRINADFGSALTMSGTIGNSAAWDTKLYIGGGGNVALNNNVTGGLTLIKDGLGTLTLGGTANTYSGGTIISGGTLAISTISRLSANGMVELNGGKLQYTGSTATVARNLRLNNVSGSSIDVSSLTATLTNSGVMDGAGGFAKTGAGTLELTGANTYTGKTTVSQGTLKLSGSGSIASSTTIEVQAGAFLDASATGFNLGSTQTLSGSGTVTGTMTVAGTLSPGSSPGTLSTGSQIWTTGSDYNWQVYDATGAAGTGYDTVAVTGTLDLSGLADGGFNINLWSLAGIAPDTNGNALNFNSGTNYSWVLASASGGITGFEAGDFVINTAANNDTNGFLNSTDGGLFSVDQDGNNLVLNFTAAAVPEPSALLLGSLGLLAFARRRR